MGYRRKALSILLTLAMFVALLPAVRTDASAAGYVAQLGEKNTQA